MSLGHWNKQHRQVLYKGVDITEKIGLCICDQCTEEIRNEIDARQSKTLECPDDCEYREGRFCIAGDACVRKAGDLYSPRQYKKENKA